MGQKFLKNTNYSIYVHTFFGHNSAIFSQVDLNFLLVKSMFCCSVCDFWAIVDGKKGWVATPAPIKGHWTQNPIKKLAHVWGPFGSPDILKSCSQSF